MNTEIRRSHLLLRIVAQGMFGLAFIDATLFGLGGRTDWAAAWVLTAMFALLFIGGGAWFLRADPDLLWERMNTASNIPRWDRLLVRAYYVLLLALFVTAALDAGRFQWSRAPTWVQTIGGVGILASFAIIWWCTAVNHFLSSRARIQNERGHTVVRDGPYRFVRHPMYTSLIVLMLGIALMLGSWLAVAPAISIGALFIIRTRFEDRMLDKELPGYRDYARQVPGRLLPGVW